MESGRELNFIFFIVLLCILIFLGSEGWNAYRTYLELTHGNAQTTITSLGNTNAEESMAFLVTILLFIVFLSSLFGYQLFINSLRSIKVIATAFTIIGVFSLYRLVSVSLTDELMGFYLFIVIACFFITTLTLLRVRLLRREGKLAIAIIKERRTELCAGPLFLYYTIYHYNFTGDNGRQHEGMGEITALWHRLYEVGEKLDILYLPESRPMNTYVLRKHDRHTTKNLRR